MVEVDASKHGGGGEVMIEKGTLWRLLTGYWFHFGSLISIIAFMLLGFSPVLAVFWATLLAIAVSAIRMDTALIPRIAVAIPIVIGAIMTALGYQPTEAFSSAAFVTLALAAAIGLFLPQLFPVTERLVSALRDGTVGVLNVAATCATAGIIVGVVTLTGLAQRFADIIIGYAQGSLLLTTIFTAMIVWIVGLAVPVTASYIMCAVIAAPALIKLGVPDFAAHMFIFYYAVLSEVSPPTALSPFAAAAITGGSPYKTTLQSWKYTMPAFLVPFVFVTDPLGIGLLLKVPPGGTWFDVADVTILTTTGIVALSFALQRWVIVKTNAVEDMMFWASGLLLIFPALINGILSPLIGSVGDVTIPVLHVTWHAPVGIALGVAGFVLHRTRARA